MIKLAFDELTPDQALALLSTYQTTTAQPAMEPVKLTAEQAVALHAAARPAEAPVSAAPPIASPAAAAPAPAVPIATAVPVQAPPTYTFDALARAAAPLTDIGKTPDLQALLYSFGVQALTQLPKEQYGAFATGLRGLGATI